VLFTVCTGESSEKGPDADVPAWIFAVKPGVSVVTASDFSAIGLPASSTRPTPDLRPPKLCVL